MNTLKKARLAVHPRLSLHNAARALGWGFSTLQRREADGFDPRDLSVRDLEAMAALYGVSPAALLGRAPFPDRVPQLAAAAC